MMPRGLQGEDDEPDFDPLDSAAASPPPVIGAGCLARFDPEALTDESGADYGAVDASQQEP